MPAPFSRDTDVWEILRHADAPIVMYGTGNGADKLLAVFEERGIRCRGFFASDGFVRKRTFHGLPVLSYEQAFEVYGEDMIIAVGFASNRPEVMERMTALSRRHRLYMPPVPVFGSLHEEDGRGGIFDLAYYHRHAREMETVSTFFLDEISRTCYNAVIDYRLSGDISYLTACMHTPDEWYALLHSERFFTYADMGAYTGDTLRETAHFAPELRHVIAAEPDPRTFRKLRATAWQAGIPRTELFQCAAWNCRTRLPFGAKGSRGSATDAKTAHIEVEARTPDEMLRDARPAFIKYDVEGAEREALLGSVRTLRCARPSLLISLYHRTEDIYALPLLLRQLCPDYRLYLRRGRCLPDWEIQLLAR